MTEKCGEICDLSGQRAVKMLDHLVMAWSRQFCEKPEEMSPGNKPQAIPESSGKYRRFLARRLRCQSGKGNGTRVAFRPRIFPVLFPLPDAGPELIA